MKRFYREASVAGSDHGHAVLLDERPLRTPARRRLTTPSRGLAEAIAAEWEAQADEIRPHAMPLTRLASTAVDRMPAQRAAAVDEVTGYVDAELLCHRAAAPLELVRRQQEVWQPLLDWAAETRGVRLNVTTELVPVAQPSAAVARLRARIEDLDCWSLVGVHAVTTALGSVILALAVLEDRIDAAGALQASLLDELFEIERWGQDVEIERRHANLRRDVEAAALFLERLKSGAGAALKEG